MLAIDAARTSGFRDSLYFFRKNPLAYKLNATQDEKEDLISRGKLGGHLRTRAVTLIAARSAYKLHGAKMVQNGRWVIDDYYEDRAAEEVKSKGIEPGSLVGEPPDPRAPKPAAPGGDWEEREQRERTGEWGMYRPGGPTTLFGSAGFGPFSEGPLSAPKKAFYTREGVDEHNWMFEAARRTREADADWARSRKNALKVCGGVFPEKPGDDLHFPMGVYEPHAAIVFCEFHLAACDLPLNVIVCKDRSDTQPTSSRWERLPDDEHKKAILGGTKAGKNAWGLAWVDTTMEPPTAEEKEKAYWEPIARI
jgi:chromatin structure-remodeling complex protein RSC7